MVDEKVSIVIPAYNEGERIGTTLETYGNFFKNLKREKKLKDFEILVVLNACKDNTLDVVKNFQKKFKEILFLDFEQGGKGFAITEGFKDALTRDNDLIGFVDADLATMPEYFYDLVKNIENYDGILASRWKKGAVIKTPQTILRIITSRGFNFLIRTILLLNYSDTQCGAKLFNRKAVKSIVNEPGTAEWAYDVDILFRLKRRKFRIKEIATVWEAKGGSKLSLIKVPFQMFSSILRIRLIYSPFKFVVRIYDKLPEKIKIHSW